MNYLLDTHSLIWFIGGDEQLSSQAREEIENEENQIFVSIASLVEMEFHSSERCRRHPLRGALSPRTSGRTSFARTAFASLLLFPFCFVQLPVFLRS